MERQQTDSAATTPAAPHPAATQMQAIVQDTYGDADNLRLDQIPAPAVDVDDVLIDVRAAGVHIGDWHVMTGQPYLMRIMGFGFRGPKARVRGMDVAGTVAAVGANVSGFQPGDAVYGTCDGAFAEHATARIATLAAKPAGLTFEQAAAIPTSACTALQALRDAGRITAGQRVLIIGASGGVGLFAAQIAKAFGAEVTGVCSGAKAELVRSVGADHVIDYTDTDITTSGQRYDLVLDMGGDRTLAQLRRCVTPHGTLVLGGGEGRGRLVGGTMVRSIHAAILALTGLIDNGKAPRVIDRTYPLSEAADAIRHLHTGRAKEKLIITV